MSVTRKQISEVLHELPKLIPEMDTAEQTTVACYLADALLKLDGTRGILTGSLDGVLYEIKFTAERLADQ